KRLFTANSLYSIRRTFWPSCQADSRKSSGNRGCPILFYNSRLDSMETFSTALTYASALRDKVKLQPIGSSWLGVRIASGHFRWHNPCFLVSDPKKHKGNAMTKHENNLIWLKDMIEHLSDSREQLEWAQDCFALRMITDTMLRDLDCCRRLCESLQRR